MSKIRALLFDLGGVIFETSFDHCVRELARLSSPESARLLLEYNKITQPEFLTLFETGRISTEEFRVQLRKELKILPACTDAALDAAWQSIVLGVFPDRERLLQTLAKSYRLFVLSNTNELHMQDLERDYRAVFSCFTRCFYSYQLGDRKPNTAIFNATLTRIGLSPEEILFIDDLKANVDAASRLGFQTVFLPVPSLLVQALSKKTGQDLGLLAI